MAENSAGEVPKLLKSCHREKSGSRRRKHRKDRSGGDGSSSQDGCGGGEIDVESSDSCSEEEMYVSKPWKKFGKCPRFLETEFQEVLRSAPPFCFQKRQSRIDWRTLHAIDVDALIQEIDIGKLETVLDTIAFGDIQGEDTRNFTEQNFIKLFRLAQLMIEYLLHAQEVLAEHKSQLLGTGAALQKRGEKLRLRCLWQRDALKQAQRDLKHAKKTLKTYEILLRSNGKPATLQQVHHCPSCEKVFESAHYLDLHISRRHPKTTDRTERTDRSDRTDRAPEAALGARVEEKTAARVRAETEAVLQAEYDRQHTVSYDDRNTAAYGQVSSLQRALQESNNRLEEAQYQLDLLQSQIHASPRSRQRDDHVEDEDSGKRLRQLEGKIEDVQHQLQHINKENIKLRTELDAAYRELSSLRSDRRHKMTDSQMEDLQKQNEELKKYFRKTEDHGGMSKEFTVQEHARNAKALKDWVSETDERFSEITMGITEGDTTDLQAEDKRSRHSEETMSVKRLEQPARGQLVEIEDHTPTSEKEQWMKEHQYAPIPDMPYALSKYPHGAATVSTMHGKMSQQFDAKLSEELKKFGIAANASGISDEMLSAAVGVLERQRQSRYREAPSNERRIMEYERSTIQWHIERAVRTRDLDKMESIFEEETESEPEDGGKSEISDDDITDTIVEERTPRSSPSCGRPSPSCGRPSPSYGRRSPSPPRDTFQQDFNFPAKSRGGQSSGFSEQFISKAFSWRADDESESHTFRVTGEVIAQRLKSPNSEVQHRIVISPVTSPVGMPINEDEQVEEDLGLGDWESDDGKASSPRSPEIARQVMRDIQSRVASPTNDKATAKQKGKQQALAGTSTSRSKQHASSSNASEDIKMLDELDAEINEIIKL